jgi:hypothetical protein
MCVAPVACARSSGASSGRERPRGWCSEGSLDRPTVSDYKITPMIFKGRLFETVGVQMPPSPPTKCFKVPKRSPRGSPKDPQGLPEYPWVPVSRNVLWVNVILDVLFPLFEFARLAPEPRQSALSYEACLEGSGQ